MSQAYEQVACPQQPLNEVDHSSPSNRSRGGSYLGGEWRLMGYMHFGHSVKKFTGFHCVYEKNGLGSMWAARIDEDPCAMPLEGRSTPILRARSISTAARHKRCSKMMHLHRSTPTVSAQRTNLVLNTKGKVRNLVVA